MGSLLSGIGSLVGGLFGKPTVQPAGFQMPNMGGAASSAYGGIGGLGAYNVFGNELGQAQGIGQGMVDNPYGGAGMGAAFGAQGPGMGIAEQGFGNAMGIGGLPQNLFLPGAYQMMAQGFDPQQALYGRTAQQLQDQTRAGLEARGVDSSPYGAGVEGQTMSNFNIDWQNNQLQRMLAGAQGAEGLGQAAGQAGTGALQMGDAATQQLIKSALLPYSTFNMLGQNQLGTLGQLGQFGQSAAQIPEQQIKDYLGYLGQGTTQQQANTQQNIAAFGQQQQLGAGVGYGLGQIGNFFAPGFGGGGGMGGGSPWGGGYGGWSGGGMSGLDWLYGGGGVGSMGATGGGAGVMDAAMMFA
jgi:hypothetical protein